MKKGFNKQSNIVSAKIIGFNRSQVICKTENNEIITVDQLENFQHDRYFTKIMLDLLQAGLWIPINRKLKKLLRYDWLDEGAQLITD
ncbi:hypothetical protein [Liquorilactobacillus sicerae]|uniref:hypothetical protein n=1 Tax=Liquorilactobacillus sicerae TaxID=1416943 RepID=UPI00247FFE78|nr:hypothetical protein [Liquorilactobacillus sicerae]